MPSNLEVVRSGVTQVPITLLLAVPQALEQATMAYWHEAFVHPRKARFYPWTNVPMGIPSWMFSSFSSMGCVMRGMRPILRVGLRCARADFLGPQAQPPVGAPATTSPRYANQRGPRPLFPTLSSRCGLTLHRGTPLSPKGILVTVIATKGSPTGKNMTAQGPYRVGD